MRKFSRICLVLFLTSITYGQKIDTLKLKNKSNPIIYLELFGGISAISDVGVAGGTELNYQYKKNLFTFRYLDITGFKQEIVFPFAPIPFYYESKNNKEYAFLYGMRYLQNNHSYSISVGISYNHFNWPDKYIDDNFFINQENYLGFPFEANIKWFHSKNCSKLISNAAIPSGGIKIFGNISKNSFLGVGATIGLGLHKKY